MQTYRLAGIVALATILISTETMAAREKNYIVSKHMLKEILTEVNLENFKNKFPHEVVLIAQATVFILEGHPAASEPNTSAPKSVKAAQNLHKCGTLSYWGEEKLTLGKAKVLLVGGMSGNSAGPYGASPVLETLGVQTEIFSTESKSSTVSTGDADAKKICETLKDLFKGYSEKIKFTPEVEGAEVLIATGDGLVTDYNEARTELPLDRLKMTNLVVKILEIAKQLDEPLIKRIQAGEFHLVGDVSCGEGTSETKVTLNMLRKILIFKEAEAVTIKGMVRNIGYANDSPSIHNRSLGYGSVMIPYVPFVGEVGILPAANLHAYMPKDSVVNGDSVNSILHYFLTPHKVREVLDTIEIPEQPNPNSVPAKLKFEPATKTWEIEKHSGNFKNHFDGTRGRIGFDYAELVSPEADIYVDQNWTDFKDKEATRTFFKKVAQVIRTKRT